MNWSMIETYYKLWIVICLDRQYVKFWKNKFNGYTGLSEVTCKLVLNIEQRTHFCTVSVQQFSRILTKVLCLNTEILTVELLWSLSRATACSLWRDHRYTHRHKNVHPNPVAQDRFHLSHCITKVSITSTSQRKDSPNSHHPVDFVGTLLITYKLTTFKHFKL